MASTVTIDLRHVARGLDIPQRQVQAVVELLDEGNTIPFITRYRKDQTGGLDEDQIRQIQARLAKLRQLADRKQTILRSIEAQGKLTDELAQQILAAATTKRLEDLYLPFRPKKQTLATTARSRGLEPLAREILEAAPACADLDARAQDFVNPDRQVPTAADALLGAGYILAEQFSEQAELRQKLRDILQRTGRFVSTRIGGESKDQPGESKEPSGEPKGPGGRPKGPAGGPEGQGDAKQPADEPKGAGGEAADPKDQAGDARNHIGESKDQVGEPQDRPDDVAAPAGESEGQAGEANDSGGEPKDHSDEGVKPGDESGDGSEQPPKPPTVYQIIQDPDDAEPPPDDDPPDSDDDPPAAEIAEPPAEASDDSVELGTEAIVEQPGQPTTDGQADGASERPVAVEPDGQSPSAAEPAAAPPPETAVQPSAEPAAQAPTEPAAAAPPAAPPRSKRRKAESKSSRLSKKELKKKQAEERLTRAFRDYFDYHEDLKKIPPHRVLAINRGERAKVLRVKIESDAEAMQRAVEESLVPADHPHAEYLRGCARDALSRLMLPSLEREIRREMTDRAEQHAVEVFAKNLRNLLLQPPIRGRRVLAVDPGFKSGCKLVALDQFGNILEHGVIYLVGPATRREQAKQKVAELVTRYELSVAVIGNGTACRQAEEFFAELIGNELKEQGLRYVIVNEAGASVYSVSRLGREEFPDYDATVRGAISIGRRLQDPLSELVKIDAANIGVGLYQHDVRAKHLRSSLDDVVESCVNYVGVDVNSASPALLRYVSGLNQLTARRVYEHRCQNGPFRSREQLREVPGFGEATFVQAAGFLKIAGGDNPLDATWIHPESYVAADRVLASLGATSADLAEKAAAADLSQRLAEVDVEATAQQLGVGALTLKDILAQLARPGRDPREDLPAPVFKQGVLKIEDLSPGMELNGTVLNVVDFGAFVDIGMHDSGLVHVSQLADRFVRDPHEVVAVGDVVRVWVISVDKERRRVSLTMIQPGSQRPRHASRPGAKPEQEQGAPPERGQRDQRGERGQRGQRDHGRGGSKPRGDRRGAKPHGRSRSQEAAPRTYHPKPRPKPVVPLTEAMKKGKAPLRTFGDLAQFLQLQQSSAKEEEPPTDPSPAPSDSQATPPDHEAAPAAETQPPEPDRAPGGSEAAAAGDAASGDRAPTEDAPAENSHDPAEGTQESDGPSPPSQ